jgi:hypothetical protein
MGAPIFPTRGQVRPSTPIVQGAINALANKPSAYIGRTLPTIQAPRETVNGELRVHTTGKIFTLDPRDLFGDSKGDAVWNPKSEPELGIGVRPGSVDYDCVRYGRDELVDLWTASQSQLPISLNELELAAVVSRLLIMEEVRFESFYTNAANTSNSITLAGGEEFGTATGSDISPNNSANVVGVLLDAAERIRDYGQDPNYLVVPRKVVRALRQHSKILDYLPDNTERLMLVDMQLKGILSRILGIPVERIHFGTARRNNAGPNVAMNLVDIHDETIYMAHVDPNPTVSPDPVSGNLSVSPTAALRIEAVGFMPDIIEDKVRACERVRIWHAETFMAVEPRLACTITNTIG